MKNLLLLLIFFSTVQNIDAQDSIKTYMYGHSLLDHRPPLYPTPSDETTVAHWLYLLAQHDNNYFAATGQYGFLRQHAYNVTNSNWWYDSVPGPWDYSMTPFSNADFDNILIAPGNFIQDQAPHANYWTDTVSPLDVSHQIINWVQAQEPGARIYIYESWPDMGTIAPTFPPNATQFATYNNFTLSSFHQWFEEYHDSLELQHTSNCVKMIPAGPAIAKVLTMAPYNTIPIDSIYEDNAPHGRPTLYFLAGLVTYMTIYEKKAPANFPVPNLVHSTIANNYNQLVDSIWADLFSYNSTTSRVFCTNTPLSLTEEESTKKIVKTKIFPNPAHDFIELDVDPKNTRVSLYSMMGRNIFYKRQLRNSKIDLSALCNGQYILCIHSPNKTEQLLITKK